MKTTSGRSHEEWGAILHATAAGGRYALDEPEARRLLEAYGLTAQDGRGSCRPAVDDRQDGEVVRVRALQDASFGPVALIERGGTETPVLVLAPATAQAVSVATAGAHHGLGEAIVAVSRVVEDHPYVAEVGVTLLLSSGGGGPVTADAWLLLATAAPATPTPARDLRLDLRAVCAPRSIAIVGASDDVRKWGGSALRNILDGGFQGAVYPVSPRGGEFFGLRVYESIEDLPEAPDVALLAVGGVQAGAVLEQCGRRGVHAAVVIAAGFSETGEEGRTAEQALAATAGAAGLTLIGPNCMGIVTNETRLHATGYIALHPRRGPMSLVSQSGNLGAQLVKAAERRGIGLDKFISSGNEAQADFIDLLDYLRGDESTGCVLLYVEGVKDGRRFLEVATATTAVKPVVALRGGLTDEGRRAAAAHTGAVACSPVVYEAAARQAGVVTCTAMDEAMDLVAALAHLPLPAGRRVAVASNGGGVGVLAVDELVRRGLVLAELPAELIEQLNELLPPFWSRRNMVDMVATAGDTAPGVLASLARSDAFDAVIMLSALAIPSTMAQEERPGELGDQDCLSPRETALLALTAELMDETGKPIVHVSDMPLQRSVFASSGRYSPVVLQSPRAAALVVDRMAWYEARRAKQPVS